MEKVFDYYLESFIVFTGDFETKRQKAISYEIELGIGGGSLLKMEKSILFSSDSYKEYSFRDRISPYLAPVPYRGKRNEKCVIWLEKYKIN